jgi:hypothetical protein
LQLLHFLTCWHCTMWLGDAAAVATALLPLLLPQQQDSTPLLGAALTSACSQHHGWVTAVVRLIQGAALQITAASASLGMCQHTMMQALCRSAASS